jgi:hypothetical protein
MVSITPEQALEMLIYELISKLENEAGRRSARKKFCA